MINTLVWGFYNSNFNNIIKSLEQKKIINPKIWVGKNKAFCTHSIRDFHEFNELDFKYEKNNIFFELIDELNSENEIVFDMMSRSTESLNKSYSEIKNIYTYYLKYFISLLLNNDIKLILFICIPHISVEYILYKVAKKMGIRVIMLNQSLFANRFFLLEDLNEYGLFTSIPNNINENKFSIENTFKKEIFYMDKKYFKNVSCLKSNLKILRKSILPFTKQKVTFFDIIVKILKCNSYNKKSQTYEVDNIDFNKKYVYFPLHLQPELTTSPLGDKYSDQLLAIEELSNILPDTWKIYVKENPKQLEHKRDSFFYKRIKTLENVVLVSKNINTYKLLNHCNFVATVTGTVGWEAISGGKNVLIFGKAWYRSLDGVFEFKDNVDLDRIINYKINHKLLEKKFNLLMEKSRIGVIEKVYRNLVDNFDEDKNILNIENALEKQILEGIK